MAERQTSEQPPPKVQDEKASAEAATEGNEHLTIWERLPERLQRKLVEAGFMDEELTSDAALIAMVKNDEKKMIGFAKDMVQLAMIRSFISEVENLAPDQFAKDDEAQRQNVLDREIELEKLRIERLHLESRGDEADAAEDNYSIGTYEGHLRALPRYDLLCEVELDLVITGPLIENAVMQQRISKLLSKALELIRIEEITVQEPTLVDATRCCWLINLRAITARSFAVESLRQDIPQYMRKVMSSYAVKVSIVSCDPWGNGGAGTAQWRQWTPDVVGICLSMIGPFALLDQIREGGLTGEEEFDKVLCLAIARALNWDCFVDLIKSNDHADWSEGDVADDRIDCVFMEFCTTLQQGRAFGSYLHQYCTASELNALIRWEDLVFDRSCDQEPLCRWQILCQGMPVKVHQIVQIANKRSKSALVATKRDVQFECFQCPKSVLLRKVALPMVSRPGEFATIIRNYDSEIGDLDDDQSILDRYNFMGSSDLCFYDYSVLFSFPMKSIDWNEDIRFSVWSASLRSFVF